MIVDVIQAKSNVFITARERGKRVPALCRDSHNIWVNFGREFLAQVISPTAGFANRINTGMVRYIGLGVGGVDQGVDIAGTFPTINTHYPGQNTYSDAVISTAYLERPAKVSGTAGVGASPGVWMKEMSAPPTFSGSPASKVDFEVLFNTTDLHLSGAYPSVPLSEIGLMLSSASLSLDSNEVYDYGSAPAYINAATRQKVIAYNTFDTITKTTAVSLEIHWQIQF